MKAHGKKLILPALFFQGLAVVLSTISMGAMILTAFIPNSNIPQYYSALKIPQIAILCAVIGIALMMITALEMLFGREAPKIPRLIVLHGDSKFKDHHKDGEDLHKAA